MQTQHFLGSVTLEVIQISLVGDVVFHDLHGAKTYDSKQKARAEFRKFCQSLIANGWRVIKP